MQPRYTTTAFHPSRAQLDQVVFQRALAADRPDQYLLDDRRRARAAARAERYYTREPGRKRPKATDRGAL